MSSIHIKPNSIQRIIWMFKKKKCEHILLSLVSVYILKGILSRNFFVFCFFVKIQSLEELENNDLTQSQSEFINESPTYKSMEDLNFNGYEAIFSRQHLNDSKLEIILSEEEKATFDEIKKAIGNKEIFNKPVIVRCAGGWVRDNY